MESLGYLFGVLFLIVIFGFSVASVVWGCRKHSRKAKWLGGISFLIGTLLTVAILFESLFEDKVELNPLIDNDAEITGLWVDNGGMLTLTTNHTFNYRGSARSVSGTWTRDDWNLYLNSSNYGAQMRFIQFRGQYRLMPHQTVNNPLNLKMWDDLGMSRQ